MTLRYAALVCALFACSSCASAFKKKCESTNWRAYGEEIAKRGQRVTFDTFVQQCEKEGASIDHAGLSDGFGKGLEEYCTPDFAYRVGRNGDFLSEEMCAGNPAERSMKERHSQGVRDYCQPTNGVPAGAAGKKYNQICPKELEAAFLPQFNEGRKKYLNGLLVQRQGEDRDLDREIQDLERRRAMLSVEISRLESGRMPAYLYDPKTNPQGAALVQQNNQRIDGEVRSRRWELNRIEGDIGAHRQKQSGIRDEIHQAQGELATY